MYRLELTEEQKAKLDRLLYETRMHDTEMTLEWNNACAHFKPGGYLHLDLIGTVKILDWPNNIPEKWIQHIYIRRVDLGSYPWKHPSEWWILVAPNLDLLNNGK